MSAAADAITTDALTRSFGDTRAVDAVTLHARPGEVLALLGPNGAGKTTTVRLLNGVIRPDSGSARVLGLDPADSGDALRCRTGVLTENAGLDDRLTVEENLVAVARMRRMSAPAARQRTGELLERFSMGDRARQLVQGLSTGQRKRVALARALLGQPEVLFLDEPTSGLDPEGTRDVIALIDDLAADSGTTVVLCTHFLGEAGRLADRVAVLDRGRLLAFGTPIEIAAQFWTGVHVDVEIDPSVPAEAVAAVAQVRAVEPISGGVRLTVDDRESINAVVAALVHKEICVYAVVPRPPTLEDVYFAVLEAGRA